METPLQLPLRVLLLVELLEIRLVVLQVVRYPDGRALINRPVAQSQDHDLEVGRTRH